MDWYYPVLSGALTGEAGGLQGEQIGKIEIFDFFSYVAISKEIAKAALARLQNGKIKAYSLNACEYDIDFETGKLSNEVYVK